jgi:glycosyltransferase involved in cell wall biosynthesis
VEQQSAAALFIPLVRILKKPLVLDCHDVFQALRVRHTSAFRKILETFLEKVAYRNADLIVTVSENEKQCLVSRGVEEDKVTVIPNGVNTEIFSRRERCGSGIALEGKRTVIFVGNMEYLPNREAVHLIDAEIAPRVKKAVPNVRFLVVGRADNSIKSENLVFAGVVNNVVDFLATSDVAIAPLLHGSGTRLKILEYFSCGLPVVSTSVGVEGLDVENGVHCLIDDDINGFATKVIKLLRDNGLSTRLGKAARALVVDNYDWKQIAKQLDMECVKLLDRMSH